MSTGKSETEKGFCFVLNPLVAEMPEDTTDDIVLEKKVCDFSVPSRDVNNQTLPGWK
jgi:hypothetical protein